MGLNRDMQDLVNKIKKPSILYLPRNHIEEVLKKDLSTLESVGFLNTLFILNKKG